MALILVITTNAIFELNLRTCEVKEFDKMVEVKKTTNQQINIPVKVDKKTEDPNTKPKVTRNDQSPKAKVVYDETFVLTFYTDLAEENGPYGAITCNGKRLAAGMVANNVLPQGTKIMTKEFGQLVVSDKGGKNFNTRNRLDVFIPRNKGESDRQYKRRVANMGIVKVKGRKI